MRILIAEDSQTQAVDLRRRLEAMGHEVVVTGDGLQAWKQLQARPERLVITDWMMPEMNGLELCRKIRAELTSRYVYIILLTAKSHRHERLQGLNAGADDFLAKPIDSVELEIALKAAQRIISAQEALQARARELEQAKAELARVASHDELTGLLNDRGFEEALAEHSAGPWPTSFRSRWRWWSSTTSIGSDRDSARRTGIDSWRTSVACAARRAAIATSRPGLASMGSP